MSTTESSAPTAKPTTGCADGDPAVLVRGLVKSYGPVRAVAGLDLRIARGEVFALLGPNGAGKTTTVEILEGYRRRDGGDVTVLGVDPGRDRPQLKRRIGVVLQSAGVDRYLTVAETVRMYGTCYPHPSEADEVLDLVGLTEQRDMRVIRLSGGQQRRLDMAIALVGNPELLFLDEPTTGFDPSARREAWQVIKNLTARATTVLLTTHYMDEAQYLADRVAVVAAGRIVAEGDPATLGGRDLARPHVRFHSGRQLPPGLDILAHTESDGVIDIVPRNLTATLRQLTQWACAHDICLDDLEIHRPSLEDVYLRLTQDDSTAEAN